MVYAFSGLLSPAEKVRTAAMPPRFGSASGQTA